MKPPFIGGFFVSHKLPQKVHYSTIKLNRTIEWSRYMNFSVITVSFPIDEETYEEINQLCIQAEVEDFKQYQQVMNLPLAKSYEAKGFYVLVYEDDQNELVGAAAAVDLMGLNTYEWSMIVGPMYRKLGIGQALYNVLQDGLVARGSDGQLALAVEGSYFGKEFLEKNGFQYSFSEATLKANVESIQSELSISVRPFEVKDTHVLCEIFSAGFGDTEDESLELIQFNSTTEGLNLWVVERNDKVVGTVTTRKEGLEQWITAFAVHPNNSGQGIGSEILMWVKDYALRNGEKFVMLDVEVDNIRALSIYEKNDFSIASQINYYVNLG